MMNSQYLIILSNNEDKILIKEFLTSIIDNVKIKDESVILAFFEDMDTCFLEENLKSFIFDTSLDIKCYVGNKFESKRIDLIIKYLNTVTNNSVYTEKSLLDELLLTNNKDLKELVLKDYLFDMDMQDFIIGFVKNDLNVSKASKALYMHRNTVINRLERFYEKTGYDLRKFQDAYIVYSLIK